MEWYMLVATVFPSFTLGVAVTNYFYSKRIRKISEANSADADNLFHSSFKSGWDAANNDVTNVKLQYDKIVNPYKHAPEEV